MIQFLLAASTLLPAQSQSPARPQTPPVPPAPAVVDKIPWFPGTLENALAEGKAKNKLILGFCGADQDTGSTTMRQTTFSDDRVVAALANVVCVRVDIVSKTPFVSSIPIRYLPVVVWFNPDWSPRDRLDGVYDPESFLAETARIINDLGTINELKRKMVGHEQDVDAHFELFLRLRAAGDFKGSVAEKATIKRLDPKGVSRAGLRFQYEDLTNAIEKYWLEKGQLPMDKVEALRSFVELQEDPEILWDGWMRLANTHEFLERQAAGKVEEVKAQRAARRECLSRAWRGVPLSHDFLRDWCLQTSEIFWSQRDELSDADKTFFLNLTTRMVQLFEQEADTFVYRARALKLNGKLGDANAAARKAVELAPNDPKYQQVVQEIQGS